MKIVTNNEEKVRSFISTLIHYRYLYKGVLLIRFFFEISNSNNSKFSPVIKLSKEGVSVTDAVITEEFTEYREAPEMINKQVRLHLQ